MTMRFDASITWAFGALMFGFTAVIFLPSTSTSAFSKSPTALSSERTQPPLIRIGRPACVGLVAACASPPAAAATSGAAATPAAVVQRNCRRDRPFVGRQHGQPELNGCVM